MIWAARPFFGVDAVGTLGKPKGDRPYPTILRGPNPTLSETPISLRPGTLRNPKL